MLFIRLIRFLRGVVTFTLTGGFVERFFNLCTRAGVPIWGLKKEREIATACTSAKGYKSLRHIARKTGVRMRIQKKSGLPFFTLHYRKRTGLLAGAVAGGLFLLVMSQFLWSIELSGNETLSDEYILSNLQECGIYEGRYIRNIDTLVAENQMLLKTPSLSWIAINLRASTAEVEMHEREAPPEMVDAGGACNVIAARTGQIVEMEVYDGKPMLMVGDTVQEGELIVSAYMEGTSEKKRGYFVHARARVIAEFVQDFEIAVPLKEELRIPTGRVVNRRSLELFGLNIPLSFGGAPKGESERSEIRMQGNLFSLKLPLFVNSERYVMQEVRETTLTEAEARELALLKLQDYERDFSALGTIESKTASGMLREGEYVVRAQFTLRQDIARQRAIEVNDTGERMPGAPKQK